MQDWTVKVENAQASVMTVKRLDTLLRDGSPIQAGDSDDVHVDRLESVGRPGLMSVVSEALVELGLQSMAEPFRRPPNPWLAAFGYGLLGVIAGGISLWLFPREEPA